MKFFSSLVLVSPLLLLAACGGGGSSSGGSAPSSAPKGTASMTFAWPSRTRAIPLAANSLSVTLSHQGKTVGSRIVARPAGDAPTSTVVIGALPYGDLQYTITAYPSKSATGIAQASGAGTVHVAAGATGAIAVSLSSTARTLAISPGAPQIALGNSFAVSATAKDEVGNVVLLSSLGGSEAVVWTSDDPATAPVVGAGATATVQGAKEGSTTLRASLARDDGGGTLSASATATVASAGGVVIVK